MKRIIKPVVTISKKALDKTDRRLTDTYFFLFSFLTAVVLFSASTIATEYRILNPDKTAPLISFYNQLHIFIFLIVSLLLVGIIFDYLKKWTWAALFLKYFYYSLSLIILMWGVYTYIVL